MDWNKYGYIVGSRYRQKIVLCINSKQKTPKQVSQETNIPITHVSSMLKDLSKNNIVKLLTPNIKKGKLFSLTKDGLEIAKRLKKIV